jgi:hypothetical protein
MLGTSAQIERMLQRVGSLVTYGLQTCYGALDREDVIDNSTGELQIVGERITLVIRDGALANLANDTPITVAGADGGTFNIVSPGSGQADGCRTLTLVES